jgi:hypothetical protein
MDPNANPSKPRPSRKTRQRWRVVFRTLIQPPIAASDKVAPRPRL